MRDVRRDESAHFSLCHDPRTCKRGSLISIDRYNDGSGWRNVETATTEEMGSTSRRKDSSSIRVGRALSRSLPTFRQYAAAPVLPSLRKMSEAVTSPCRRWRWNSRHGGEGRYGSHSVVSLSAGSIVDYE